MDKKTATENKTKSAIKTKDISEILKVQHPQNYYHMHITNRRYENQHKQCLTDVLK